MKRLLKAPLFWGFLAAIIIGIPQIDSYSIIATDATHTVYLEGWKDYPGYGPFSLYNFADGSAETMNRLISDGFYPWFINLDHKMNLFRPIPSLLIYLNHKLSRLNAWGYPFHSLLWYLLVIFLLDRFICLILPGSKDGRYKPVRYIALLIFALASRNYFFIVYGGARYYLVVIAFGLAGLMAHIKWREQDWKPGRWLSLVFFLLCLLSGEAALALIAFLVVYELLAAPDTIKERINALAPVAVLVVLYIIFYKLMDYGTANFQHYINPFNDPTGFIAALPVRLAAMVGELFLGTMSVINVIPQSVFMPPAWHYLLAAAAAIIIIGGLFYPIWKSESNPLRRRFRWLFAAIFTAMVPLAPALPNSRVVIILSLAGSIILAIIIVHWWRRIRERPKSLAWIGAIACLMLAGIHLIYSTYIWFPGTKEFKMFMAEWNNMHRTSVLNEIKPNQTAVFLNGTGGDSFMSGFRHRLILRLPMPEQWWPLSYMPKHFKYTRVGENALELQFLDDKCLYDNPAVLGRSSDNPLEKGEELVFRGLRIHILDVNKKGPTRLRFTFDHSLDDPQYVFYRLYRGKLEIIPSSELNTDAGPDWGKTESADKVEIVYDVYGKGEKGIVFIHGGFAGREFWTQQVRYFGKQQQYKVIALDLAGHGGSGSNRQTWGIVPFAQDVRAVMDKEKIKQAVLVGNSLGGPVALETASLIPDRVTGIIAVDTFQLFRPATPEAYLRQQIEAMQKDFTGTMKKFAEELLPKDADSELKAFVEKKMLNNKESVGVGIMESFIGYNMIETLKNLSVPIRCINGDMHPTQVEQNRAIYSDFDAVIMPGCGHYPMIEKPQLFNRHLEEFLLSIWKKE